MKSRSFLLLVASLCFLTLHAGNLRAQSRSIGAHTLVLDDDSGHTVAITIPTMSGPGPYSWILPITPGGTENTLPIGTHDNSILRWNGSAWVEDTNVLATDTTIIVTDTSVIIGNQSSSLTLQGDSVDIEDAVGMTINAKSLGSTTIGNWNGGNMAIYGTNVGMWGLGTCSFQDGEGMHLNDSGTGPTYLGNSSTGASTVIQGFDVSLYGQSLSAQPDVLHLNDSGFGPTYLGNSSGGVFLDAPLIMSAGPIFMGGNSILGLADPINAQDAATKHYVDTKGTLTLPYFASQSSGGNSTLFRVSNTDNVDPNANAIEGDAVAGFGVLGVSSGSGIGVYAENTGMGPAMEASASNGDGLIINSTNGLTIYATDHSANSSWAAVDGTSALGTGVAGVSTSGTGVEGFVGSGGSGTAVVAENQGSGIALSATSSVGTGDAIDASASSSGYALNATGNVTVSGNLNVGTTFTQYAESVTLTGSLTLDGKANIYNLASGAATYAITMPTVTQGQVYYIHNATGVAQTVSGTSVPSGQTATVVYFGSAGWIVTNVY